jgi:hypothetical protein
MVFFRRGSSRVSYCNEIGQGFLLEWGQARFFTVEMGQTGFSTGMESARDPNGTGHRVGFLPEKRFPAEIWDQIESLRWDQTRFLTE